MNRTTLKLFTAFLFLVQQSQCGLITTANNLDPQPLYTAHYPNSFLTWAQKAHLAGIDRQPYVNRINLSVMPYFQRANKGTDIFGNHQASLGDLTGRINVLATLPFNVPYTTDTPPVPPATFTNTYQDIPCGYTSYPFLEEIRGLLLRDIANVFMPAAPPTGPTPEELRSVQDILEVSRAQTQSMLKNIGCLDSNIRYRKYGVRFNAEVYLFWGLGAVFCGGFSSLEQTPQLVDMTPTAVIPSTPTPPFLGYPIAIGAGLLPSNITNEQWLDVLGVISQDVMARREQIGQAISQNLKTYSETSIDDINIDLYWRGLFPAQMQRQIIPGQAPEVYSSYCVMPFASLGGTIAVAKEKDVNKVFSAPFGNNGHNAFRARVGVAIDFYETIEICGEFGFTHFSSRDVSGLHIPTNTYQNGMYPFAHDANVQPGNNTHIGLGMFAYHFAQMVSASCAYVFINHAQDRITLVPSDPNATPVNAATVTAMQCNPVAFRPDLLAAKTPWQAQVVNASLCCDISPSARGFLLVQIPVARRNAYRSTTYGLSLEIGF